MVAAVKAKLAVMVLFAAVVAWPSIARADDDGPPYPLRWMQGGGARVGAVWFHKQGDATSGPGVELTFGQALVGYVGPLWVGAAQEHVLRILDSKSVAFSFTVYSLTAGARLGPLEPFASVGVSSLTLDVIHGDYSAELFAPRIAAGVAARVSRKVRIVATAHSEFLWRWFSDSYRIQGIAIGVEVMRPSL